MITPKDVIDKLYYFDQMIKNLTNKVKPSEHDHTAISEYSTITYYHSMYRDGQITKDELVMALDEILCH